DFAAVLVVYKSREGYWKGFAHPYDVTTEGNTKKDTLTKLQLLVNVYEDELRQFKFPSHLVHKPQSDLEDREMFRRVVNDAVEEKGIVDRFDYHAETHQVRS
ncbi:MAG: hypothetical protein Q7S26_04420, partial [bacterium]|nr:hypothetical protein [bacterium]